MKKIVFIMGVSGSGKSSVGELLSNVLSVPFIDADDHHPKANIEKMSKGIPLNDSDRMPWLDALHTIAEKHLDTGCVIACSALKEQYRTRLSQSIEPDTVWIYLQGSYEQIYERMNARKGHFMDSGMLKSQFEALEEPKNAIIIDIADSLKDIVKNLHTMQKLKKD